MRWDPDRLKRTWTSLVASMRSLDWHLIVLIAGFVLVAPIPGVKDGPISSPLLWLSRLFVTDPFAAYEDAVAAAALKRPGYQRPLATIDQASATVNVVHFGSPQDPPLRKRTREIWVALRDDVRDACVGAADPVRTLQQILGLPPVAAGSSVVMELEVPRDALFRPCIERGDISKQTCDFDFDSEVPNPPDPPAAEADAAKLREAYEQLRDADYRLRDADYRLRFLTKQMWDSYRMGFRDERRSPSDYPYTGFPFTGMGWTYNWGNSSADHFGVTEFVVKREPEIKIVAKKNPADFCRKPG